MQQHFFCRRRHMYSVYIAWVPQSKKISCRKTLNDEISLDKKVNNYVTRLEKVGLFRIILLSVSTL